MWSLWMLLDFLFSIEYIQFSLIYQIVSSYVLEGWCYSDNPVGLTTWGWVIEDQSLSLFCFRRQGTVLHIISPSLHMYRVLENSKENLTKWCWWSCVGLPSHPRGVVTLLVNCFIPQKLVKPQPCGFPAAQMQLNPPWWLLSFSFCAYSQGLEGYSRDPGFDQNTWRDSGKRKISWRDSGFDCYQSINQINQKGQSTS